MGSITAEKVTVVNNDALKYVERRIGSEPEGGNGITVLITGFGPFHDHTVNASWETARLIPERGISLPSNITSETPIKILAYELPVVYKAVSSAVPYLWEKHRPDLVIHIGVSSIARAITIEQAAHNCGYSSPDVSDCIPDGNVCVTDGCDVMESGFPMREIVSKVNSTAKGIWAEISYDPGRFLCDFTYYQSLNINRDRAAFIHVPRLNKPWSAEEMADAVCICITEFLSRLHQRNALSISGSSEGEDSYNLEQNRL